MTNDAKTHSLGDMEWRREAFTMAFYVAVVLIAALVAFDDSRRLPALGLVWGTTVGLALAHLFAFDLATRLVKGSFKSDDDRSLASAQLTGAVAVALVATVPVLLFPDERVLDAMRFVLSALIALAAFAVGKNSGASTLRSSVFAVLVLIVGVAVALIKNLLLGH